MSTKNDEIVIIAAVRTPIGSYKGSLKNIKGDQLGSIVIKEVINRSNINKEKIDEVVMGQVLTAGTGQNPARQAAINAGLSKLVPAHLVNQVCGSGLRSVISGFQTLKLDEAKYMICGGQESMSLAPHALLYRNEKKLLKDKLIDTMICDGLFDVFNNYHMGVTAENVADKFEISRQEQDEFALNLKLKLLSFASEGVFLGVPPKLKDMVFIGFRFFLNSIGKSVLEFFSLASSYMIGNLTAFCFLS